MIPAPRFIGIAVLGHRRVLPERRAEIAAGGGGHLHQLRLLQHGGGGQHPRLVLRVGQQARQHLRRLHRQQDAGAGFQDLLLLRRMQQHHGIDDQVGGLQRTLRRRLPVSAVSPQ